MTRWRRTGREGRRPPSDCPSVDPAIRPSLRRTRLLPRAAPLPARLLRVQPGWAASGQRRQPGRLQATAELGREEQVGQLGGAVGDPRAVEGRAGDVVRPQPSHAVQVRADRDDARPRSSSRCGRGAVPSARSGPDGSSPSAVRSRRPSGGRACPSPRRCSPACRGGRARPGRLSAARRTDTRSARSRWRSSSDERSSSLSILSRARRAFSSSRQARITCAPCAASATRRLVADAAVRSGDEGDAAREIADVRGAPRVGAGDLAARRSSSRVRSCVGGHRSERFRSGRVEARDLLRRQGDVGRRGRSDGRLGTAAARNRDHPRALGQHPGQRHLLRAGADLGPPPRRRPGRSPESGRSGRCRPWGSTG